MQAEYLVFAKLAIAGFFALYAGAGKAGKAAGKGKGKDSKRVLNVDEKKSYVETLQEELKDDVPHFNTLRKLAAKKAKGYDYFSVQIEGETWLFPVSQAHLHELYSMTDMGGKLETIPFEMAVGYAPRGMPFTKTDEHWEQLRKNLAPIFKTEFFNAYSGYFKTAVKDLVSKWKGANRKTVSVKSDICDMAFASALMCLTGATLDVDVPYHSGEGVKEQHIKDVNCKTLNDFAKHAATKEYVQDKNYRLKSNSAKLNHLNQNMDTLGGALTGLVEARAGELAGGAESKLTIVDAAYGLLTQGVIKDVNEAVQHGWAILNGAHSNCGNALAAALYYLLSNPECYKKLKEEIDQLTGGDGSKYRHFLILS